MNYEDAIRCIAEHTVESFRGGKIEDTAVLQNKTSILVDILEQITSNKELEYIYLAPYQALDEDQKKIFVEIINTIKESVDCNGIFYINAFGSVISYHDPIAAEIIDAILCWVAINEE